MIDRDALREFGRISAKQGYIEGRKQGWNDIIDILKDIEDKKLEGEPEAIKARLEALIFESLREINLNAEVQARRASFKLIKNDHPVEESILTAKTN